MRSSRVLLIRSGIFGLLIELRPVRLNTILRNCVDLPYIPQVGPPWCRPLLGPVVSFFVSGLFASSHFRTRDLGAAHYLSSAERPAGKMEPLQTTPRGLMGLGRFERPSQAHLPLSRVPKPEGWTKLPHSPDAARYRMAR